jgi:hypothetical protein
MRSTRWEFAKCSISSVVANIEKDDQKYEKPEARSFTGSSCLWRRSKKYRWPNPFFRRWLLTDCLFSRLLWDSQRMFGQHLRQTYFDGKVWWNHVWPPQSVLRLYHSENHLYPPSTTVDFKHSSWNPFPFFWKTLVPKLLGKWCAFLHFLPYRKSHHHSSLSTLIDLAVSHCQPPHFTSS